METVKQKRICALTSFGCIFQENTGNMFYSERRSVGNLPKVKVSVKLEDFCDPP